MPPLRHLRLPTGGEQGPGMQLGYRQPQQAPQESCHTRRRSCIQFLPTELNSLSTQNAAKASFRKTRLTDVINSSASSFIRSSYAAHLLHQRATTLNRHCLHAGIPCNSTTPKSVLALGLSSSRWLQDSEDRTSLTSLSNTACSHSHLRRHLPAWSHSHLNTEGKTRWLSGRHTSVKNFS